VRKSGLSHLVDIQVRVKGELTVREGHAIAHAVKDALLGSASHAIPEKRTGIPATEQLARDSITSLSPTPIIPMALTSPTCG